MILGNVFRARRHFQIPLEQDAFCPGAHQQEEQKKGTFTGLLYSMIWHFLFKVHLAEEKRKSSYSKGYSTYLECPLRILKVNVCFFIKGLKRRGQMQCLKIHKVPSVSEKYIQFFFIFDTKVQICIWWLKITIETKWKHIILIFGLKKCKHETFLANVQRLWMLASV